MSASVSTNERVLYDEQGFFIFSEPVLPAVLVERAVAGMDAVRAGDYDTGAPPDESPWNPGDDPNKLCKIENPQFANRAVHELVSHPTLGRLAGQLTGADWVQVWWVQLLYKPTGLATPDDDTKIGWHTDIQYWAPCWERQSELFTAWVAVSDVTERSGPMMFVPGSHKRDLADQGDFFAQDLSKLRESIRLPDGASWTETPALMAPGGVSFHDKRTLHGSGPNQSDEPRRSFAIHMRTQKSHPLEDRRVGLTEYIDDEQKCPIVYRADGDRPR